MLGNLLKDNEAEEDGNKKMVPAKPATKKATDFGFSCGGQFVAQRLSRSLSHKFQTIRPQPRQQPKSLTKTRRTTTVVNSGCAYKSWKTLQALTLEVRIGRGPTGHINIKILSPGICAHHHPAFPGRSYLIYMRAWTSLVSVSGSF